MKITAKTLIAIGSERKIPLQEIGIPAVLIFHGRETAGAAKVINRPIRDRYPSSSQLTVASVVDMHSVPRLLRGMAEGIMLQAYQEASNELPDDMPVEDYMLLLPDWDGGVTRSVGLRDTNRKAGIAVLDSQGNILGVYQAEADPEAWEDLAETALDLLVPEMHERN